MSSEALEKLMLLVPMLQEHAVQLARDIALSATREQHIRMTTRLNETETIINELRETHALLLL